MPDRYTVHDMARKAGTRRTPYPATGPDPTERRCPGCGAPLHGKVNHAGLPISYCGQTCQRAANMVWRTRMDDERALTSRGYSW